MKSIAKISVVCASLVFGQFVATNASADELSDHNAQIDTLTKRVDGLEKALAVKDAAGKNAPATNAPDTPQENSAETPFRPSAQAPISAGTSPFTYGSKNVSVTLYGLISAGLVSASNVNGKDFNGFLSGPQQPPRFGAKTFWDLGSGNSAVAVLEGGYSIANGTLGQGGRIFGRQAYVGAQSANWGAVTFGRQYDEVSQQLWWSESGNVFATFGDHIGDNDNIANTFRLNNSIRYQSPKFEKFGFAGQYAASNSFATNQTSQVQNNSAWSIGGNYDARDSSQNGLRAAAAYTNLNRPSSSTNASGAVDSGYGFSSPFITSPTSAKAGVAKHSMAVVGASYTFGPYTLTSSYSDVHFNYLDSSGLELKNAELFGTMYVTPKLLVGLAFMKTRGAYTTGTNPEWKQINIGIDYFFNKYLDLFLVDNYQRAGGSATSAWIYTLNPSSTKTQNALTAGIRVKF